MIEIGNDNMSRCYSLPFSCPCQGRSSSKEILPCSRLNSFIWLNLDEFFYLVQAFLNLCKFITIANVCFHCDKQNQNN